MVEFGVFLPIANNGWILSETSPQYRPTFELNRTITQLAEQNGFGFALSMVKFRGYGGPTRHWDYCQDSLTLMTGLAAVTSRIKLFASVAPITLHPALVARMAATIDDISGGRFGINIVAGWNRAEYAQMGLWPGDDFYRYRYDYAQEYAHILRALWEHGKLTHHGRFDLDDCQVLPTPEHGVKLISAGQSPRGQEFCARYCDYHFSAVGDPAAVAAMNRRTHELAAGHGRSVTSLNLATIVLGDTDADARRKVELYTEGADVEAIGFMTGQYSLDTAKDGSSASVVSGHGGPRPSPFYGGAEPIVGSAATVAAQLEEMAAIEGTGGIMLVFDDFIEGVARFGAEVRPLLSSFTAPS
ncbi:LLM class flavin-dependent oxidoreductase [Kineosporia succinea]|uniref:Pyrimidine oxygenase n=1 Tax=Kineosporia succinea TaxID=84632 RepID=A0ABT9PCF7_9ACTN|nr:LLM class flavin-dependent oxidoreductase [Kineosporia succinea]MDP9830394.1 pyrimidine oxygenase [Kineosporia succinea]